MEISEWKQHDFASKFQLFLSELKIKIVQCTNRVIYPDVSTFSALALVPIGNSPQGRELLQSPLRTEFSIPTPLSPIPAAIGSPAVPM